MKDFLEFILCKILLRKLNMTYVKNCMLLSQINLKSNKQSYNFEN